MDVGARMSVALQNFPGFHFYEKAKNFDIRTILFVFEIFSFFFILYFDGAQNESLVRTILRRTGSTYSESDVRRRLWALPLPFPTPNANDICFFQACGMYTNSTSSPNNCQLTIIRVTDAK